MRLYDYLTLENIKELEKKLKIRIKCRKKGRLKVKKRIFS